jgi:putative tail protein
VVTASRNDQPNVLQMQCVGRNSNYNQIVVSQPEAASIALYGVRKADPLVNTAVQDPGVARALLGVAVRRNQYGSDSYNFKLSRRWMLLLAPMDLVTITDPLVGITRLPVRIQSIGEDGSCAAKPFVYGMETPGALTVTGPVPYQPSTGDGAGDVNPPVIFEPMPRLYGSTPQAQLWLAVSSPAENYGGCVPYISTDGGLSYNPAGDPLVGSAITGVSTADWPAASDPDSTHNLPLDLTESLGVLESYQTSDEDNALYPCYIAGGGQPVPYELMTYAIATLTATNKYTLQATGAGNYLHRGVFGAPSPGVGVDHPSGSRWAFLAPGDRAILKLPLDPTWIGKTLWFKFCSFNSFGSAVQSLSDVVAYPYTVLGIAGVGLPHNTYTIDGGGPGPQFVLSQPSATEIDLEACQASFGGLPPVNYSARAFTIPAPAVPTWYYVTIADRTQQGESSPTLVATCQTDDSLVGVQGNTYMGAIQALPAGGATVVLPGGWPAPSSFQVVP